MTSSARAARQNRLAECARYVTDTEADETASAARLAGEGVTIDQRKCAYIVRESRDPGFGEGSYYLLGKAGPARARTHDLTQPGAPC